MTTEGKAQLSTTNLEERRVWLGNLDTRITEFQLLKIVQKCGAIEKFDMIFHKSGPQFGQPRGYAFVTYAEARSAMRAISKMNGTLIGSRNMIVRLAKNINYEEFDRSKPRIEIPALAAGASTSTKMSKEFTIQAIEAKLRALESKEDDFEVNKTSTNEIPLIQRYQYNKNTERMGHSQHSTKLGLSRAKHSGPYDRRPRHQRR